WTQGVTWGANGSFHSMGSMAVARRPARGSALRDGGMGPRPMQDGSTPALAAARVLAIGRALSRWARDSDIITRHAAPSLRGDELPAVTVPSFSKAGFSAASFSRLVSARAPSSVSQV